MIFDSTRSTSISNSIPRTITFLRSETVSRCYLSAINCYTQDPSSNAMVSFLPESCRVHSINPSLSPQLQILAPGLPHQIHLFVRRTMPIRRYHSQDLLDNIADRYRSTGKCKRRGQILWRRRRQTMYLSYRHSHQRTSSQVAYLFSQYLYYSGPWERHLDSRGKDQ